MATYTRNIVESIGPVTDHVAAELYPGVQDRDWRLRWQMLEERLAGVVGPRPEACSRLSIHMAAQELFEFFVSAYHLKDALIADGAVEKQVVEDAITNSKTLALLTDLANLDKHRMLTRKPRSPEAPIIGRVSSKADPSAAGWRLRVSIRHCGQERDGVTFAGEVIDEWRAHLRAWGLV